RFEFGHVGRIEQLFQFVDRRDFREIAFVVLDDVGKLVEQISLLAQVGTEVLEAFEVGFDAADLRIGDEDDVVHAFQDELAARVVKDLAGNGVEVKAGFEAFDFAERERKKVEEERALRLGGKGDHLAFGVGIGAFVDVLEVGRFAAEAGAVIDDFAVNPPGHVVDKAHRSCLFQSLKRLSMSSSVISAKGESAPGSCTFLRRDSKMPLSSSLAFFTRKRTRPRLDLESKITTRMTRFPTN